MARQLLEQIKAWDKTKGPYWGKTWASWSPWLTPLQWGLRLSFSQFYFGPRLISLLDQFIRNRIETVRLQVLHQYQGILSEESQGLWPNREGVESTASELWGLAVRMSTWDLPFEYILYLLKHSLQCLDTIKIKVVSCKQTSHWGKWDGQEMLQPSTGESSLGEGAKGGGLRA